MPLRGTTPCGAKTRAGKPCQNPAMRNARCRMHGGTTPRGMSSPHTTHGRHSKDLPTRLATRYHEAEHDPVLLELRSEIALLDARMHDVLGRVDTGESGEVWRTLRAVMKAFTAAEHARDTQQMAVHLRTLRQLITQGTTDEAAWGDVQSLLEQRRRFVESERKRLVEMQHVITAERAMVLLAAVVDVIRRHVHDRTTLNAISMDIRALIEAGPYPED